MHRVPNVISISSDEEDEEKTSPGPGNVDEVSLIAIDRKRKKNDGDDIEDGVVVIVVPDKEPLEEVTSHYEDPIYLVDNEAAKPPIKKLGKTLAPLIDLLSEEEEDEEIVFRPVTLAPKAKRIKPTPLANNKTKKAKLNKHNDVVDKFPTVTVIENDTNFEILVEEDNIIAEDSLILPQMLSPSFNPAPKISIMDNPLISKYITRKDTEDVVKITENGLLNENTTTTLLDGFHIEENLNNTILPENNGEEYALDDRNDDDDEDSSSSSDADSNKQNSTSDSEPLDKSPEANLQRFKAFLRLCSNKITEAKTKKTFREKHTKFLKLYKVARDFVNTNGFQKTMCDVMDVVKNSKNSYEVVKEVMKIYAILKEHHKKESTRSVADDEKLDHLYELLKQFTDKIKTLETVEVDYDDEENSTYCQLHTYRAKAVKVHERICAREKKSKYQDRLTYAKLDFDRSSYQSINVAINKMYKNNAVFPTFCDLNRLVRITVKENNIEISEISLKEEIKTCFVLLGELLQRRRRHELLDVLTDFVDPKLVDPAINNPTLDRTLFENKRVAYQKTNEICEKYCKIQESGVEPELSSDPDDSNVEANSSSDEAS